MLLVNDPVLRNAKEICAFIKRDPRQIKDLVERDGLPAWKEDGVYYAIPDDLIEWLKERRNRFLVR